MVLGILHKERDLHESDQLFADLAKVEMPVFDDARDDKKIAIAIRFLGARHCGSPKADGISEKLQAMIREDADAIQKANQTRQDIFKKADANSLPYRNQFYKRATDLANEVIRFCKTTRTEQSKNIVTDQVTKRRKTNQATIDQIQARILDARSEIFGMRNRPLREILQKIEEFDEWWGSLDLYEIEPTEVIEQTSALPKWARDGA